MCGFVGAYQLDGRPVLNADLVLCRDTLSHRGPDDAGVFLDGPVGLAHRRLAVIDLSPMGRQPMVSEDGAVVMVYNGEVYNFRELREDLRGRGYRFRGGSDSEVVLRGYEAWGEKVFERLDGMFAVGLWDSSRRRVVFARDPLGQKPLYVYHDPRRLLVFASQLKAIMAYPGVNRALSVDGLSGYLGYGFLPRESCILSQTRKIAPGTIASFSVDTGKWREYRYWDLERLVRARYEANKGEDPSREGLLEELEAVVRAAVKKRLVADVPLGAFLSGGIDSSLVVAMIAREASSGVSAYTVGFEDEAYDESPAAAAIAEHLGVRHEVLRLTEDDVLDQVGKIVETFDEPMADFSALPTMAVSQLAREHVTVALSGDGGDEAFAGYDGYRAILLYERFGESMPVGVRRALARIGQRAPQSGLMRTLARMDASDAAEYSSRFGYYSGSVDSRALQAVVGSTPIQPIGADIEAFVRQRPTGMPAVEAMMLWDALNTLPEAYLHKVDRASMGVGLEVRCPLLDRKVIEWGFERAVSEKLSVRRTKIPLRQLLCRFIPPALVDRPKKGFTPPLDEWIRGRLRVRFEDELRGEALRRLGLNEREVVRVLRAHLSGRENHRHLLWALFMLVRWCNKYLPD